MFRRLFPACCTIVGFGSPPEFRRKRRDLHLSALSLLGVETEFRNVRTSLSVTGTAPQKWPPWWPWYAGTPESDDFDQKESGNVLLVEIDGPRHPPRVERLKTGFYNWQRIETVASSPSAPDQLQAALSQLTNTSDPCSRL